MNKRTRTSLLSLALVVALLGCSRPSPIVEKVIDAGSEDPAKMSDTAIEQWFAHHTSVAADVVRDCRATQNNQPNWSQSTDARVCSAAIAATTFKPMHVQGTGKTY